MIRGRAVVLYCVLLAFCVAVVCCSDAAHADELRCLTRAEYAARVLEPKARLVACVEDLDTVEAQSVALRAALTVSEQNRRDLVDELAAAERRRKRERAWYALGGGALTAAVLIGSASLVARVSR